MTSELRIAEQSNLLPKAKLVEIAKINDIGAQIDGYRAVTSEDGSRVFNIVTPSYKVIQHDEMIDKMRGTIKRYGLDFKETITPVNDGARVHVEYTFPGLEEPVTPNVGDIIRFKAFCDNSYDGSTGLRILFGAERLVCENGMVSMDRGAGYYHKHTSGLEMDKIIGALEDGISFYKHHFIERTKRFYEMPMRPAAMLEQIEQWKENKLIPQKHLNKADAWIRAGISVEGAVEYKSQYDFYNVMTAVVTHNVTSLDARTKYGQKVDREFGEMLLAA